MRIQGSSLVVCVAVSALLGLVGVDASAASTDVRSCRNPSDTVTIGTLAQADEVSTLGVVPIARLDADHVDWPGGLVEVSDASGDVVAGAVEVVAGRFAVFRPALPLVDGEAYEITASGVHIRQLFRDPVDGGSTSDARWSFVSVDEPLATVGEREVETSPEYRLREDLTRGSLVCCDGAYPNRRSDMVCFDNGLCGSTIGVGSLVLDIAAAQSAPAAARANSFLRQVGDETIVGPDHCYGVEVVDLTTGAAVTSFERCHATPDAELGDVEIDPLPALTERCRDQPYVCEVEDDGEDESRWDRDACTPVFALEEIPASEDEEDADEARGCSVQSGRRVPAGLVLVCLGLVLARRRAHIDW